MGKEKRHKAVQRRETPASSLDAIIEESRQLRRQMADDLSHEAKKVRRMSRHVARSRRSRGSDEHSA